MANIFIVHIGTVLHDGMHRYLIFTHQGTYLSQQGGSEQDQYHKGAGGELPLQLPLLTFCFLVFCDFFAFFATLSMLIFVQNEPLVTVRLKVSSSTGYGLPLP